MSPLSKGSETEFGVTDHAYGLGIGLEAAERGDAKRSPPW
jgi:hypothetical protein